MADINQKTRALEWLEMSKSKWRLQTLQFRGRYNPKTGEYKKLPDRLRRFLNGTPVGMVHLALRTLVDAAPYKSPVFNWEFDDELLYRPTSTSIIKDSTQQASNTKDATYTIVQDLRLCEDTDDWIGFQESSSCSQLSDADYRWDMAEVEPCPDASQGVTWQVVNVSRDSETDLFSYNLRKNTAITQHFPETTVKCTDRARTTVETWDNVYGEPGDWRWDFAVNGGAGIEIPEPCGQECGTAVEVSFSENQDCTFKIQVQRTYSSQVVDQQYSTFMDQYKVQTSERDVGMPAPLPKEGVEYSGGVMTKYTSELNEDGTWTNQVDVETERPVPASQSETRVTPRGLTTSWTDTNQVTPASGLPGGYEFGSWKTTKTPGGLFNNEFVGFSRKIVDGLASSCTDTAFMHSHESSGTAEEIPASYHVPAAGKGTVTSVSFQTDDQGNITKTVKTDSEHTVGNAKVTVRVSAKGTSRATETRSAASAPGEPTNYGESTTYEVTNGRMFNVVKEVFKSSSGVAMADRDSKTATLHVHSKSSTEGSMSTASAAAASGGVYSTVELTMDNDGSVVRQVTVNTENSIPEYDVQTTRTPYGTVRRTTSKSARSVPALGAAVGSSVEFRVTDGNLFDVTTVTPTAAGGVKTGADCETTVFEHRHATTGTGSSVDEEADKAGGGSTHRVSTSIDQSTGAVVTQRTTTRELPFPNSGNEVTVTSRGTRTTTVNRNQAGFVASPGSIGSTVQNQVNPGGSVNQTITTFTPNPRSGGVQCENTALRHSHTNVKFDTSGVSEAGAGGVNRDSAVTSTLGDDGLWENRTTSVTHMQKSTSGFSTRVSPGRTETTTVYRNSPSPRPCSGSVAHGSGSLNEHGSVDGQVTVVSLSRVGATFTSETNALVTKKTTVYHNAKVPDNAGTNGTASASVGDDGVYTGQSTSETPIPKQFPYGPYTSSEESPFGRGTIVVKKTVRGIVFANQASIPTVPTDGEGQVSISCSAAINKYGLIDGKIESTLTTKKWNSGGSGGGGATENKNIISSPYTVTHTRVTPLGIGEDDGKPIVLVQTIETTHRTGVNCDSVPSGLLEGSSVTMTKSGLYNYHAVTASRVTNSVVKHGSDVTA